MIRILARRALTIAFAAVLLPACEGGSTTPRVLGDLVVVSGDDQTTTVGGKLRDPLVVKVVDDQGKPIRGVHISWEVGIGGGQLSSQRTVTGKNGQTSVQATITVPGQSAIFATIDEPIDALYRVEFIATAEP